jgi:O-antigen/teichoic acid export membrane protein
MLQDANDGGAPLEGIGGDELGPAGTVPVPPAEGSVSEAQRDVGTAFRNGIKLGGSLLATWSVALFLRFLLPRFLGPAQFGVFNFSDAFAATYFVFLGLGIETYIQREVPVRPDHVSDFFGSVMALRFVLSAFLLGALALTLSFAHRPVEVQRLVFLFGCGQLLVTVNGTLSALLQARTTVGGLALINIAGKVLWGVGVVAGLVLNVALEFLALALVASELLKAVILYQVVRKEFVLAIRFDFRALKAVLITSVPFYLNTIVVTLCSKLDITMLEFLTGDSTAVGWYSASSNIASLAMLLSPLLIWVVMPLMSRAAARSEEELWWIVRRAIGGIYIVTLPIMLMCVLGADFWVKILFGAAFAPAAMSLRAQAPLFMLTYLAMLLSMALIVLKRPWKLTIVSTIGVIVNPTFVSLLVPFMGRRLGPGGEGVGAALGVVGMELVVTTLLLHDLGRKVLDRRILTIMGKSLLGCAVVGAIHVALASLGPARLAIDLALYVALAFGLGTVKVSEVKAVLQAARSPGKDAPAPA